MLGIFSAGLARYLKLVVLATLGLFDRERNFFGALLALVLLPVIAFLQLVHCVLWIVDEIVFSGYRTVRIKTPVFIIGPPRTGTTFLHHALAKDQHFCTFRLWECLFGITVSGRKLCLALAALDRLLGSPMTRLISILTKRLLGGLDDIHPVSLRSPEEDFFVFMPAACCFLLIVPYPRAKWLFQFSRFDSDFPARKQKHYMRWYRRCIQKHLYVNGVERQFLSKNASLAGMTEALLDEFPDARILATWRDPVESVPSQLSSLLPSLRWFGMPNLPKALQDQLVEQMVFYYEHLESAQRQHPHRVSTVRSVDMRSDLESTVRSAFAQLELTIRDLLAEKLQQQARLSRRHTSAHRYCAEDFGLSDDRIRGQFGMGAA